MVVKIGLPDPVSRDLRINLRRRYVLVAEHLLYRPEIGPTVKQVCCKGMPDGMRRYLQSSEGAQPLKRLPETLSSHRPAPVGEKQKRRLSALEQKRSQL